LKSTRLDKYGKISSLLSERGRGRVLAILEALALKGDFITWELAKTVMRERDHQEPSYRKTQAEYGTFHKAIDRLLKTDYIAQHGSVRHSTHKKEEFLPKYGLTVKGWLVAMVLSEKVRQNWQAWVGNALKDAALPAEWKTILAKFIEYGASQLLFLKFFVDPNERLVTSTYNMDEVDGKTFMDACVEKMILTFEEGKFNPYKNLPPKDRNILAKIYQDPNIQKIRASYLDFLKEEYSEKAEKIGEFRKTVFE
jgi:hypothetical protein